VEFATQGDTPLYHPEAGSGFLFQAGAVTVAPTPIPDGNMCHKQIFDHEIWALLPAAGQSMSPLP
jgi:hypothetical protein